MDRGVRRLLLALGGLGLLGLALVGARAAALASLGGALRANRCTWTGTAHSLVEPAWTGVSCPGVDLDEVRLLPLVGTARLRGGSLDLEVVGPELLRRRAGAGEAAGEAAAGAEASPSDRLRRLLQRVEVEDLDLRWGETLVAEALAGTAWPVLDLSGPGTRVGPDGDGLEARLQRPLDLGPLSGEAELAARATPDGALTVTISGAAWTLRHDLVGPRPLGPFAASLGPLDVDLDGGSAAGEFELLGLIGTLQARVGGGAEALVVDLSLPAQPLAALYGEPAVQALVPEARGAEVAGTVAFTGRLAGPPWRLTGEPRVAGLSAEGVVPQVETLRRGGITWRTEGADGSVQVRRAGPGARGWTRPAEAMTVARAFMAAEDRRFLQHGGVDDYALGEALQAMAADLEAGGEVRVRGASTLSQQLAKNLFLDGERTLTRKLRELLYALELERALGKDRILELYLNVVELGPDIYGVSAAADAYFLKRPAALTAKEAAFLAVLLPSPRRGHAQWYLPGRVPEGRIAAVLEGMVEIGALSPEQAAREAARELRFVPPGD